MTDPALYGAGEHDSWHLDIDIINGQPVLLNAPQEQNTEQQRKAVLAYQVIRSIPGDWNRGVDWSNILARKDIPLAEAMMQVQLAVDDDQAASSYTVPIIIPNSDTVTVQLLTVTQEQIKEGNVWLS